MKGSIKLSRTKLWLESQFVTFNENFANVLETPTEFAMKQLQA